MELPKEVETKFKEVLQDEISIAEFEKWVYESHLLEKCLPQAKYMELISLDYKTITYYDIRKFVIEYIDLGEVETKHILSIIKKIRNREGDLSVLEKEFKAIKGGYEFLKHIEFPYYNEIYDTESFNKRFPRLSTEHQLIIIKYRILMFNLELDSLIAAIESGRVKIEHNRGKHFEEFDDRDANEHPANLCYLTKETLRKYWDLDV